jgi:hypothetical protein
MGRRRPMAQNGFPLRIGFRSFPASIQARKGPVQRYVIDEFEFPIEELDIDPIGASVTGQKPDVLGVFRVEKHFCSRDVLFRSSEQVHPVRRARPLEVVVERLGCPRVSDHAHVG